MRNLDKVKKVTDATREHVARFIEKIRDFFKIEDSLHEGIDEGRRGLFKLGTGAIVASMAPKPVANLNNISRNKINDVIAVFQATHNGSDVFLRYIFEALDGNSEDAKSFFAKRISALFNMDDSILSDGKFRNVILNLKSLQRELSFQNLHALLSDQLIIESMDINEDVAKNVLKTIKDKNLTGSINQFVNENIIQPLFKRAREFVSKIEDAGIDKASAQEKEFVNEIYQYLKKHKDDFIRVIPYNEFVDFESKLKVINFKLNSREILNELSGDEIRDILEKKKMINIAPNSVLVSEYAVAEQFARKAFAEGREVILQAYGQENIITTVKQEHFLALFNRVQNESLSGIVQIIKTATISELLINKVKI